MLQTLREKQIGKKKNGRIEKINTARHDFFSHLLGQNWVSYPFIYRCSVGLDALFCISTGNVRAQLCSFLHTTSSRDAGWRREHPQLVTCSCKLPILCWFGGVQQAVLKIRLFFLALVKSWSLTLSFLLFRKLNAFGLFPAQF